jgi:SAM-dependent methyltransferase
MKNIDYCSICGSKNVKLYSSAMDGFVVNRMLKNSNRPDPFPSCSLICCLDCEGRSSSFRFDEAEEKVYYFQYMKEDYLKERSVRDVAEYYASEENKSNRRTAASSVMIKHINFEQIKSVLDFGGDTGEMIPVELAHAHQYVVDQDERSLDSKVKFVNSPEEIDSVDLVMCCHTLEHVSDPCSVINEIKKYMQAGSWLYIEVPNEATWDPADGFHFHEHINLFTSNTLTHLMKLHGFVPIDATLLPYGGQMPPALAIMGIMK